MRDFSAKVLTTTDIAVRGGSKLRYQIDALNDALTLTLEDDSNFTLSLERDCLPHWITALTEARDHLESVHALEDENTWTQSVERETPWHTLPSDASR